ncbi:MAG: hypothetical protein ACLU9T_17990 [Blautia faecis]
MNQKRKKWLALFLSLLLLVCGSVFTGCGGDSSSGSQLTCTIRDLLCDGSGSHGRVKGNQKEGFVPEDGQILKKTTVSFTTGESVFDILKAICGEKGIQISSKYTPLYNSYYVEGINQLYELDCREKNSGWMYRCQWDISKLWGICV